MAEVTAVVVVMPDFLAGATRGSPAAATPPAVLADTLMRADIPERGLIRGRTQECVQESRLRATSIAFRPRAVPTCTTESVFVMASVMA